MAAIRFGDGGYGGLNKGVATTQSQFQSSQSMFVSSSDMLRLTGKVGIQIGSTRSLRTHASGTAAVMWTWTGSQSQFLLSSALHTTRSNFRNSTI